MVCSWAPQGRACRQFFCIRATRQVHTAWSFSGSSSSSSSGREILNWGLLQNVSVNKAGQHGSALPWGERAAQSWACLLDRAGWDLWGPCVPSHTWVVPTAPRGAAAPPAALIEGGVPTGLVVPGESIGGQVTDLQQREVVQEVFVGHPVGLGDRGQRLEPAASPYP